ncbi:MAG: bifunctional hydroxymethylpyrimidine kinase/phosphomethylpyrimidine kinase [Thermoleophilia bacterium]|nr:bifunctional hydroxymethylpyrimidine kinase/phosphomethylpyrimidine kinase [Thermoleophilia bacterium]MDH3724614.1 bifunctional hydroxymethylpyrimidine kinase/phosphomethylpyrimidine kinase [Thermoleophilia bacterium]
MTDARTALADARLYLVAPARIRAGRLAELIPLLADAGIDIVQLRDRSLSEADLLAEGRAAAAAAQAAGIPFIVNDSPTLARDCRAHGVHLGQDDGPIKDARALLGPDAIIGRSSRGGDMLAAAAAEGASYASLGPIWETPTKPGRPATGIAPLRPAAQAAPLPWFAIGGIDEDRVLRVAACGADRAVVVRAICDAVDPAAATRRIKARLVAAKPRIMTVAGSDSGGGAGIQADIKAISQAGGFPLCAVTALTAQTTRGVEGVLPATEELVAQQIEIVAADIGVDGIKTGMLASPSLVGAVAEALRLARRPELEIPLVVDTVLRAESGACLMARDGEEALTRELIPDATVITPNLMEAQALTGSDSEDAAYLAQTLCDRHGCAAIVTGGHGPSADDVLCDAVGVERIPGVRLDRATTHGAGCTHSSTLAALLGRGLTLREAAAGAKAVATAAVRGGRPFGAGAGPVDVTSHEVAT